MGGTPAPKQFPPPGSIGLSEGYAPLTQAQAPPLVTPPPTTPQFGASTISSMNPDVATQGGLKAPTLPQNPYAQMAKDRTKFQQAAAGRAQGYLGNQFPTSY